MKFFEINYQLVTLIILNHFSITKFNFKLVKTLKLKGGHLPHAYTHKSETHRFSNKILIDNTTFFGEGRSHPQPSIPHIIVHQKHLTLNKTIGGDGLWVGGC